MLALEIKINKNYLLKIFNLQGLRFKRKNISKFNLKIPNKPKNYMWKTKIYLEI